MIIIIRQDHVKLKPLIPKLQAIETNPESSVKRVDIEISISQSSVFHHL